MLLHVGLVCSIVMIIVNVLHSLTVVKYKIHKGYVPKNSNLFSSGEIWILLVDVVLFLIQPYSFLENYEFKQFNSEQNLEIVYTLNDIMTILLIFRTVPIFLMIFSGIKYNSNRSDRIW